jgi:CRISPR-associated protein Cas2
MQNSEMEVMMDIFNYDQVEEQNDKKYLILIIYDIIDNKRRYRMAKFLSGYGFRVQKSAFECKLNKGKYNQLIKRIDKIISKEDLLRVYKFYENTEVKKWGERKEENMEDFFIF